MPIDPSAPTPIWRFYVSDDDHSTDWNNHAYGMFLVARGQGETPQDAWQHAVMTGEVPEAFDLTSPPTVAVRERDELDVDLKPVLPRFQRTVTYEIEASSPLEANEIWEEYGPEISDTRALTILNPGEITVATATQ